MVAKKRGPGRPPKSKNKKPAATATHTVPKHFWSQIGAILLAVVTAILIAGLFGMGGELPVQFANAVRWLVGWTAFIIPVIFAVQIVQVFKQPEDRIPAVIWVSTIIFLALFAGTFQLALPDPTSLTMAQSGNGGGTIGWAVADMALGFVNVPIAALIFVTLMLVLLMFIFSISPGTVVDAIRDFIGREAAEESGDNKVMATNATGAQVKFDNLEEMVDEPKAKSRGKTKSKKSGDDSKLFKRHKKDDSVDESATDNPDDSKSAKPVLADLKVHKGDQAAVVEAEVVEPSEPAHGPNWPNWKFPSLNCLGNTSTKGNPGNVNKRAFQIASTLKEFGLDGQVKGANLGPRVTQYLVAAGRGVQLSKIAGLKKEFEASLAAPDIRIETPVPGTSFVGIEVPNVTPATVGLRSLVQSPEWKKLKNKRKDGLVFAVGLDVTGDAVVMDLTELPHLLIAGTTNSGKSVMMNVIISSLLLHKSPDDLRFVLIDPKGNELAQYEDMPHLLAPVIPVNSAENVSKVVKTLTWVLGEMERRYDVMGKAGGIKKISVYNRTFPDKKLPYIVVIIDEYTDLLDKSKQTDREAIMTCTQRIAQAGRAAGIHEVILMQTPRVKYLPGILKSNIPARFAFAVVEKKESIQIINQAGAERLLGHGDMLYMTQVQKQPTRVQAAYMEDDEVDRIVTELKLQGGPHYDDNLLASLSDETPVGNGVAIGGSKKADPMYQRAVELVISTGRASTSFLQTNLGIGYGRAARIMNEMEKNGVVGPQNGAKPREILVSSLDELND